MFTECVFLSLDKDIKTIIMSYVNNDSSFRSFVACNNPAVFDCMLPYFKTKKTDMKFLKNACLSRKMSMPFYIHYFSKLSVRQILDVGLFTRIKNIDIIRHFFKNLAENLDKNLSINLDTLLLYELYQQLIEDKYIAISHKDLVLIINLFAFSISNKSIVLFTQDQFIINLIIQLWQVIDIYLVYLMYTRVPDILDTIDTRLRPAIINFTVENKWASIY